MDIRITNTCNNNCLYCLEWSLRTKEKFISADIICEEIMNEFNKKHLTFYWWNPLLHPELNKIIKYARDIWYLSIGLLTNTKELSLSLLEWLQNSWLTNIWFYFNSFENKSHILTNQGGIKLKDLIVNIRLLKKSGLFKKAIIHINKQNITTIWRDILILYSKFWIKNFELINYIPFWKAYGNKSLLEYNILDYRDDINTLFTIIEKIKVNALFLKFNKDFFWKHIEYYDEKMWILNQISQEDNEILNWDEIPYCKEISRCETCYLKYNCKWYDV